jgi:hypothetical protein
VGLGDGAVLDQLDRLGADRMGAEAARGLGVTELGRSGVATVVLRRGNLTRSRDYQRRTLRQQPAQSTLGRLSPDKILAITGSLIDP